MGRDARRGGARVWSSAAVAVAAIVLSGCFAPAPAPPRPASPPAPPPPPPSTTTTTTTTVLPPAHLVVSPTKVNLTAERTASPPEASRTITVSNDGDQPSGALAAPDLSGLAEPGGGAVATSTFSVADDQCTGQALAPGANCTFTLVLDVAAYANSSPWTGDLPVSAAPGGTADVSVTARYTSKLVFDSITALTATADPPTDGSTHFLITNDGPTDFGPMSSTLVDAGMPGGSVGSFALSTDDSFGVPACSDGMTLASGTSCQWVVSYTNPTGAGSDSAFLVFDVPGVVHAQAGFTGTGTP